MPVAALADALAELPERHLLLARLLIDLAGYWSRRIDETNRLVYRADDAELVIIACRFHYAG